MLKNIAFGVKVATNDDFCQGTVATVLYLPSTSLSVTKFLPSCFLVSYRSGTIPWTVKMHIRTAPRAKFLSSELF